MLGLGSTTIPKNSIFWEPWLFSTALRLRSVTLSHKGYAFAGVLRPVTNLFMIGYILEFQNKVAT
jgi:hypothetical protein